MTKVTQEMLDRTAGYSVREGAKVLGIPKSTYGDARAAARENGGKLPYEKSEPVVAPADDKESFNETRTEDNKGTITVSVLGELSQEDILRKFGRDPEKVRITGTLSEGHWGSDASGWRHTYKFSTEYITADDELTIKDLPLLYSQVMNDWTPEPVPFATGKSLVVVWADIQVGKTGSRGGTPELIKRVADKRAKLQKYMDENPSTNAYFLSVGDEVESFENVAQQAFTNDLSFPDQLDLELTFELELITDLAARHETVTVGGCSSNHCRWRAGKNVLGKPADDYGLYIKRQLEKALRLNSSYDHVNFEYPEEWDETMAVDVEGTVVGIAHGHQVNNPNSIEDWWRKQVFGNQATAKADVLVTGHFHTFRAQPIGRSERTGKNRWWLQAPTLDNGSDWFRNFQGNDSDDGMLVFQIDNEKGFDIKSLDIL